MKMLKRIDWMALKSGSADLGITGRFIAVDSIPEDCFASDEDILKEIHHALFEIHVQEGCLVCPETSRRFVIKDGIPNMLLHENEV